MDKIRFLNSIPPYAVCCILFALTQTPHVGTLHFFLSDDSFSYVNTQRTCLEPLHCLLPVLCVREYVRVCVLFVVHEIT